VVVDLVAILGIAALLLIAIQFEFEKYLFRLPFVTLYAFYLIGKLCRDYELKLWGRKHAGNDGALP
jgi:hypothetical protein